MAFLFPIIKNFLSYSTNCATYSRKSEKGGFVTTISASLSSSMQSLLLKSPALFSPSSSVISKSFGCLGDFLLLFCVDSLGSPDSSSALKFSKSLCLLFSKAFSVSWDCDLLAERERESSFHFSQWVHLG